MQQRWLLFRLSVITDEASPPAPRSTRNLSRREVQRGAALPSSQPKNVLTAPRQRPAVKVRGGRLRVSMRRELLRPAASSDPLQAGAGEHAAACPVRGRVERAARSPSPDGKVKVCWNGRAACWSATGVCRSELRGARRTAHRVLPLAARWALICLTTLTCRRQERTPRHQGT
jgi:hypothetical protein